jgi:ribosomal subunit interface protein
MSLTIAGKNMDIGDALRSRAEARIDSSVRKYFDGNFSGHVTVVRDGGGFRTDCSIHLDTGIVLKTSATADDATVSFDAAAERAEKRLRRYKRRLKSHHGNAADAAAFDAQSFVLATPDEDEEIPEDYNPVIVAETETRIKTMTVGMAVLELDLTEAPVIMFKNAADGVLNVVYRRADGHYGWIDPTLTNSGGK